MNVGSGASDATAQLMPDATQSAALFGPGSLLVASGAGADGPQPTSLLSEPLVTGHSAAAAPPVASLEHNSTGVAVGKKRRRGAAEGTIISSAGGAAGREAANAAARAAQAAAASGGTSAAYSSFLGSSVHGVPSAGSPLYPAGSVVGAAASSSSSSSCSSGSVGMPAVPGGPVLAAAAGGAGYGIAAGAGAGAGPVPGHVYAAAIPGTIGGALSSALSLGSVISSALVAMTVKGRASKKARTSGGGAGAAAAPSEIYMQQAARALAMTGRPLSRTDAKKIFALTDRDIDARYAEEVLAKGGELKKRPKFELEQLKAWCIAKHGSTAAFAARLETIANSGLKRSISRALGPRSVMTGAGRRRFGYGFDGDDDEDGDDEDEEGIVRGEITRRCCAEDCDSISAPLDCKNRMCRACCLETQKVIMLPMFKCKRHK